MGRELIQRLTERFIRFPGIGPRQARRFVHYLLGQPAGEVAALAEEIRALKKEIGQCEHCQRFYPRRAGKIALCEICADGRRDESVFVVVEKDIDVENLERAGNFRGQYFVLGRLFSSFAAGPQGPDRRQLLLKQLRAREQKGALKEIILAFAANQAGDETVEELQKLIKPILKENGVRLSVLGRGLSTGIELEYSDAETLKNALKNRAPLT